MFAGVAANLMADKTAIFPHVAGSFYRGEANGVYVHGIRVGVVRAGISSSRENVGDPPLLGVVFRCLGDPVLDRGGLRLLGEDHLNDFSVHSCGEYFQKGVLIGDSRPGGE